MNTTASTLPTGSGRFYTVLSISDIRNLLANATAQARKQDSLFRVTGTKPSPMRHRCVVLEGTLSASPDLAGSDGAAQASPLDMTVRPVMFGDSVPAFRPLPPSPVSASPSL